MARTKAKLDEDRLIAAHIDGRPGRAEARLRGYGVPVWALIGQLRAIGDDPDQLARDYELPREAIDAALAFYRRNRKHIDARLLLNSA